MVLKDTSYPEMCTTFNISTFYIVTSLVHNISTSLLVHLLMKMHSYFVSIVVIALFGTDISNSNTLIIFKQYYFIYLKR